MAHGSEPAADRSTDARRPPSPPVAGYGLKAPSEADALATLGRVFGDDGPGIWSTACRQAGVFVGRVSTSDQLERATRALAAQGGAAASVARSLEIRMRTYDRLAARAAARTSGPASR